MGRRKDIPTAEGTRAVYLGRVVRESDSGKAWRFAADGKVDFLPKSITTVFDNELVGEVETPQRGLSEFAVGGDRS